MTKVKLELQRLRDKEQRKYELGLTYQAKARKYFEEAKQLTFKVQRVQERITTQQQLDINKQQQVVQTTGGSYTQ